METLPDALFSENALHLTIKVMIILTLSAPMSG